MNGETDGTSVWVLQRFNGHQSTFDSVWSSEDLAVAESERQCFNQFPEEYGEWAESARNRMRTEFEWDEVTIDTPGAEQ